MVKKDSVVMGGFTVYEGQCMCGTVQLELNVGAGKKSWDNKKIASMVCHCDDCHAWNGQPFSHQLVVSYDALDIVDGEDCIKEFRLQKKTNMDNLRSAIETQDNLHHGGMDNSNSRDVQHHTRDLAEHPRVVSRTSQPEKTLPHATHGVDSTTSEGVMSNGLSKKERLEQQKLNESGISGKRTYAKGKVRCFCGECGTQLYMRNPGNKNCYHINPALFRKMCGSEKCAEKCKELWKPQFHMGCKTAVTSFEDGTPHYYDCPELGTFVDALQSQPVNGNNMSDGGDKSISFRMVDPKTNKLVTA